MYLKLTPLIFLAGTVPALGAHYEVKGYQSCEAIIQAGLEYHPHILTCPLEGRFQASHCKEAYDQLKHRGDCCPEYYPQSKTKRFHGNSCQEVKL